MRALALVVLVALTADARDGRFERTNSRTSQGRSTRGLPGDEGGAFELSPAAASSLSDATSAYRSGNWYGIDGTGTSFAGGSKTFSATGSPVSQSPRVCPNGSNCTAVSRMWLDASVGYTTGTSADSLTDFSVCWLGIVQDDGDGALVQRWHDATGGTLQWSFYKSGGSWAFYVAKPGGTSSNVPFSTQPTTRARHLVCATYDYVADGSSVATVYLDGTATGTSSTFVGPPNPTSTNTAVNLFGNTSPTVLRRQGMEGVFFTEAVMTPAQVAVVARAVLADQVQFRGQTFATSRASLSSCPVDANETAITIIPTNRPCINSVAGVGIGSFPAATNVILDSEEIYAGAWADVGTPVKTGNIGAETAPDYTRSDVDSLQDDSAAAFEGRSQAVTIATQAKYTFSVWMKTTTGTKARLTIAGTGNTAGDITCDISDLSTTEYRRRGCTSSAAYGAGLTAVTASVLVGNATGDTDTLYVWGAQLEASAYMSPYVRTTSGSQARSADTGMRLATAPDFLSRTRGCALECFVPSFDDQLPSAARYVMLGGSARLGYANSGRGYYAYDGVTEVSIGTSFAHQRRAKRCARVKWDGSTLSVFDFQNTGSAAATSLGAFDGLNIGIDTDDSSFPPGGYVGSVYVSSNPSACEAGARWAALGDSITDEPVALTVAGWPRSLQGLWGVSPSGKWITNNAVSGATSTTIRDTQWTTNTKAKGFAGVIVAGGVNDISAGETGLATYNRLKTVYDEVRAEGATLVIVTPLPAGAYWSSGTKDTELADLRTRQLAYCSTNSVSCVDAYTGLGSGVNIAAAYDSGDGLHPNQAGSDAIAALVYAAVP